MSAITDIIENVHNISSRKRLHHVYSGFPGKLFLLFLLLGICFFSSSLPIKVQAHTMGWSTSTSINASGYNLGFSTYLGGNNSDIAHAIATDSSGNSYITGYTYSNIFPLKNAYNTTYGGNGDAFVAKFDSAGNLVFSTYLGGSGNDAGNGIAVDSNGNIYITGYTLSSNFPLKNAYNQTFGGAYDVFIAKFDSTGNLVFSTYLGGNNNDFGQAIAADTAGNCYVTGYTNSNNFPTKNAYNKTFGGTADIFIAKFDPTGALKFSSYLGGNDFDIAYSIAIDTSGNYYLTGLTASSNFPTKNAYNATFGGGGNDDAFVTKFNATNNLVFSSYLGGSGTDIGSSIVVDVTGNSYITGYTASSNFPTKNAYNATFGGTYDVFITKFSPTGTLIFSTYIGGSNTDLANGIAIDSSGNYYITGKTLSSNFPTKNAYNATFGDGGNFDAFVTVFNATNALVFSTYVGGSNLDVGNGIAVDSTGNCYITGQTMSNNFPTDNGYYVTYSGGVSGDAFVTQFTSPTGGSGGVSSSASTTTTTTTTPVSSSLLFDLSILTNPLVDFILVISFFSILTNLIMVVVLLRRR